MAEYVGRMAADGNGNLLADEGDHAGEPIAYDPDTDTFVFVAKGEPSHNERHHLQFAEAVPTQSEDPEFPGYAGEDATSATEGNEHHFVDESIEPITFLPDAVSVKASGHTDQHKETGDA